MQFRKSKTFTHQSQCSIGSTAQKKPNYCPVFYRIGTDYFYIQTYEDRIREYTGSVFRRFYTVFGLNLRQIRDACFFADFFFEKRLLAKKRHFEKCAFKVERSISMQLKLNLWQKNGRRDKVPHAALDQRSHIRQRGSSPNHNKQ